MNRYETKFRNKCPVNSIVIDYYLVIEHDRKILVEDLTECLSKMMPSYHETIADYLVDKFGGKQTLRAMHHGVLITTERESLIFGSLSRNTNNAQA